MTPELPLNQILQGDCIDLLAGLPERSVDLIFADPPYNLQLQGELRRPDQSRVDAVTDDWDQFDSFAEYDAFTRGWLHACRRVLKEDGTIWVIGSYHNIFRVGSILLDLGYWILNDVQWVKRNPMPNFRGTRFQNATETLIWARKSVDQKRYTFNYQAMKAFNEGKQMPNVWEIPICSGAERLQIEGRKAHSTQKPEALLYRVILASSRPGDVVLDPFFGTGTTGAVARRLGRQWIGLERDPGYAAVAQARIDAIPVPAQKSELLITPSKRDAPRVAFSALLAEGLLQPGDSLQSKDGRVQARIHADSDLLLPDGFKGSIHRAAAHAAGTPAFNGWEFWYYLSADGPHSIDLLRDDYRARHNKDEESA